MSDATEMVGGRYRLLRTIGRGGMGTVWQAHDEVLGRDVAVKEVLPPPDLTGPEREVFAVRTFREARAAGRVAHPGVATVYDVLEENGHPWIVMQLVHSRTLGELIREDGPMSPPAAADIGLQLLEALRAAHAAGVLHRDVKPDNVLLTEDGRAVLTDFGIATTEDEAPVTSTGVLLGTPAFMAPERAAGSQAKPSSDLWSLGVTLYMAVEGHSPFQRDNPLATLGAVLHAEPEPLSRAGVLGPVLLGLLRKNPAERMSLEEAEQRLAAILTGGAPERTGPLTEPGAAGAGVVGLGAAGVGAGGVGAGGVGAGGPGAVGAGAAGPGATRPGAAAPRRRRLPLAVIAAGALVVAAVTGGAAWWSSGRARDLPQSPGPAPAVVSAPPSTSDPATSDPQLTSTPSAPDSSPPPASSPPAVESPHRTPSGERKDPTREPTPTGERKNPKRTPTPSASGKKDRENTTPSRTPDSVEPSEPGSEDADQP
ncbi:serine/threonine-protein kinase [Nonomuraea angiospora]|uniref:serine/threonine-protein kinase n=1 Tax=Nonomuraea angiospora TaxID=46172 RepID=UPI00378BD14D